MRPNDQTIRREELAALADQVGAMRGALQDQEASERPLVSPESEAYLRGAEEALRAAAEGEEFTPELG